MHKMDRPFGEDNDDEFVYLPDTPSYLSSDEYETEDNQNNTEQNNQVVEVEREDYQNGYSGSQEVNFSDMDDDDDGQDNSFTEPTTVGSSTAIRTFDTNLPTEHSYLGTDLEYLRGRVLFEENQIIPLHILPSDTIVCPGYTLPLTYFNHRNLIQDIITQDRTFGLTFALADRHEYTSVGVTMEIYEFAETAHEIKLKAKGRQRFRVLDRGEQMPVGVYRVKILPEIEMSSPLKNIQIQSLNKRRIYVTDKYTFRQNQKYRRRDAAQTRWPLWVFNNYDENYYVAEITELLKNFKEILPKEPIQLSFWVIQNFLLSTNERIEALKLDCAVQRLRLVLTYMKKPRYICCAQCQKQFASQEDLFPMSKDGLQNNFVNPGGVVHETITVLQAHRISLVGQPQTEYSWFPGYAWTIAQCRRCSHHIGWRFTAVKPHLKPEKFFGLTRSSVIIITSKPK